MSRRIAVRGAPPDPLLHVLADLGIAITEAAHLVMVSDGRPETVRSLVEADLLPVAVARDRAAAVEALAAGALAVLVPPFEAAAVQSTLAPLLRVERQWARQADARDARFRQALRDLQTTKDLLGRLIDATPNPVMAADPQGGVLVFNRAAERALGYESAWVCAHMHVTDIYADPHDSRRVLSNIRNTEHGEVQEMEVRLRARSGELVPVTLSAAEVYGADGLSIATVGVFQDRRAELALRARLEETTDQLLATQKRAAESDTVRSAAHELNQPLTAAMGLLELLGLARDLEQAHRDRIDKIYVQLERTAALIRNMALSPRQARMGDPGQLLDFSRATDE